MARSVCSLRVRVALLPMLVYALLLASSGEVLADEAGETAEVRDPEVGATRAATPPGGIEEIRVTARRRDEGLQSTPISIRVFSEDEIEARQISDVTDLASQVANMKLDNASGSSNQTRIYIRGVGQDDFRSNVDPGVGLYVDGVYLTRLAGSAVSTLDVEAIEVLRGPQGTLFGKNTVGGVVALRTRRPGAEFGGVARVGAGNFGRFDSAASLDPPLVPERLYSRLSFETQTDEGYTRNRATDTRSGDDKLLKGRVALRALIGDATEALVSYERTREDEKQPTPECRLGNPFAPGRLLTDNLARTATGADFVSSCRSDRADGEPFTAGADFDQKNDLDTQFLIGTLEWGGDHLSARSISSWRRVDIRTSAFDLDASAADGFGLRIAKDQNDAFSQELLLFGTALGDRLEYTAGVYGAREKGHSKQDVQALASAVEAIRAGRELFFAGVQSPLDPTRDLSLSDANLLALALRVSSSPTFLTDQIFSINPVVTNSFVSLSYAAFAEASFALTDRLTVTGGARYTKERKERQGKTIPVPDTTNTRLDRDGDGRADPIVGRSIDDRFGRWTGRVQLELQATDAIFAYASYSRGFKSGGFNRDVDNPDSMGDDDPGKFNEETIDSYEVGLKTEWLDRRVVFNLAAFYNRYENIQLSTVQINANGNPVVQINNVAEATIRGLELDLEAALPANLTLQASLGLIDADYRDFAAREDAASKLRRRTDIDFARCTGLSGASCPDVFSFFEVALQSLQPGELALRDFSGVERTNTPPFNASLALTHDLDLGGLGSVSTRLSYVVQGDVEYTTLNDRDVRQGRYGLLAGRVAWRLGDDLTTIALYGRNLLDRRYVSGGFDLDDTNGVKTVYYGRPRTFGIEVIRLF